MIGARSCLKGATVSGVGWGNTKEHINVIVRVWHLRGPFGDLEIARLAGTGPECTLLLTASSSKTLQQQREGVAFFHCAHLLITSSPILPDRQSPYCMAIVHSLSIPG